MISLQETALYRAELKARMTFRYGIATMSSLPHALVRVTGEFGSGASHTGWAADHLPPKWFTKDPHRDPALEIDDMVAVIQQAQRHALDMPPAPTLFAFWRELMRRQAAWARERRIAPLLAHFGTSLVERALVDAFCRIKGLTFAHALRTNAFGIDLGSIHPELAGAVPADLLPANPPASVFARHTVGLSDPLTEAEIAPEAKLHDGLPQSLEACITAYGLRHFKLKVGGKGDMPRLRAIAAVLARSAGPDYACSLDGNEGFGTVDAFKSFWDEVCADPALAEVRSRLLFVEQPFSRDIALSDEIGERLWAWPDRPAIVIDESDGELASLPRALALGYAGTTHKNCKGVFKGVANACLMNHLRRTLPDRHWSFTGEDLANIGPVALLQDLAVQASLGVSTVERNGHHYFAGLSAWPKALQEEVRSNHPDLFVASPAGWPTLRIEAGRISTQSVCAAPFGTGFDLDPVERVVPNALYVSP